MSKLIRLLDCTLRDGGYINGWKFAESDNNAIIKALLNANVECVELGYLGLRLEYSLDSSWYNRMYQVEDRLRSSGIGPKSNTQFYVMINQGDFDINLLPETSALSYDIGIRLAFHLNNIDRALQEVQSLVSKGYKVCVQPMVTLNFTKEKLIDLIDITNRIKPEAVYIVDSFGNMTPDKLRLIVALFDELLNGSISLGLHLHNNMQLAYSNALEFLSIISDQRKVMIDSSVFGMGRGAGNLNTEIITNYLNINYSKSYKEEALLQVIDNVLEREYAKNTWGFSVAHLITAQLNIHPNYGGYLLSKKTLTVGDTRAILRKIPDDQGNAFNKELISHLYYQYIIKDKNKAFDTWDIDPLKEILVIASGKNYDVEFEQVQRFVDRYSPIIIALNHIPRGLDIDYYFFTNQKRFNQHAHKIETKEKIIITYNISSDSTGVKVIPFPNESESLFVDNVSIHLLHILIKREIKRVFFAGLDGYDLNKKELYQSVESKQLVSENELIEQNELIGEKLKILSRDIKIRFVTTSIWSSLCQPLIVGVIPARYSSSRFPGKPLVDIAGKTLLQRTYDQAVQCAELESLYVATDDERIRSFCENHKIPCIMTSGYCLTGTDRVVEFSDVIDADLYVNIQGDEPLIAPEAISQVVQSYLKDRGGYSAYNLYAEIQDLQEVDSPTSIKVIVNDQQELVYMSRSPIPFSKDGEGSTYHKQVCVYGFTKKALQAFMKPKSSNEQIEDIEILRLIDNGYKVKMIKTEFDNIAVDVPADVQKVEEYLSQI